MNHTINVYNTDGKQAEKLELSLVDVAAAPINAKNFALNLRVLFQNWRQGTVGSKGRADIAFSNKKPWKQKGTGKARAGTMRSPLWRKGGCIFGPQARVRQLSVNVKQKRFAMNNVFYSMLGNDALHCLDFSLTGADKPSTKLAFNSLKQIGLSDRKINLFLTFGDDAAFASFINIPNVKIIFFDQPNVYDLATSDCWIFLKKDLELFKEMILQWN